ncbi:MAG: ATP-binding protein [Verrucomicrobiales bacterium]|nr:ATP-binding protein [Verrucomicrobiales bacterium]
MSEQQPLGIIANLELIDRLQETIEHCALRESELNRAISLSTYTLEKQYDQKLETSSEQLKKDIEDLDQNIDSTKKQAHEKYQHRQNKIERAWKNSQQHLLQSLAKTEDQQKYQIQKTLLDHQKTHSEALSQSEAEFEEFQTALLTDRKVFNALAAQASKSFRGYPSFFKKLALELKNEQNNLSPTHRSPSENRHDLHHQLQVADTNLLAFRKHLAPRSFAVLPLPLLCILVLILQLPLIPLLNHFELGEHLWTILGSLSFSLIALSSLFYFIGKIRCSKEALTITQNLKLSRRLLTHCEQALETYHQQTQQQLEQHHQSTTAQIDDQWQDVLSNAAQTRQDKPEAILDHKKQHALATLERQRQQRTQQLEAQHALNTQTRQQQFDQLISQTTDTYQKELQQAQADHQQQFADLSREWQETLEPIYAILSSNQEVAKQRFPYWTDPRWQNWQVPQSFYPFAKLGELEVDLTQLCTQLPQSKELTLPGAPQFNLPLMLEFGQHGSLLIETSDRGHAESIATLNHLMLTLLANSPAGKANFTIIDPVGLGENFSSIMHLADYENNLISDRIWTQTEHIDQRLAELNEHMEKVIQMYLRNEYQTIDEYNQQAGNIAEKYHYLVIADFPNGFSDLAAKRLLSIAASGARCGVHTLIHRDTRLRLPQDFIIEELHQNSTCLSCDEQGFALANTPPKQGIELILDSPPEPSTFTQLIQKIGDGSKDANRIEVPFSHVTPDDDQLWTGSTSNELRVAIGRSGATKLQYLSIGKGTRQHTLIAGKTGSGKSTLFHVIITNLALCCSPDEVEFYLIDFKKGIEFKCYANYQLPHARVIAIESDREFGLSVLQRVDEELKRRGDLFRKLGVQDLAAYKKTDSEQPMPRSLLMIDEFQELFVEDDRISQNASMLLDRIVRQGRAFGIHVILGSQTLGGAYTLPRTTMGQMVIRIALMCNEADAYLIMDDSNPAPRLLTRPGEGIYNDNAGAIEGNSPFQTVWISDEERDAALKKIAQLAKQSDTDYPAAVVFEGNTPADVRENAQLALSLSAHPAASRSKSPKAWLGAPNSIKGPTEVVFHRQSGNHLLIVGQNDEAAQAITSVSLVSLASQLSSERPRFFLIDGHPPDSPEHQLFENLCQKLPQETSLLNGAGIPDALQQITEELDRRAEDHSSSELPARIFLIINGLQRFKKLRYEEDFGFSMDDSEAVANPGAQLDRIIQEGASLGIHLIVVCDTYNNVNRFLSRKALSEFEMRVLFQMSANDSASLIDTPKASQLGLNRALFYNEQEGYLETFRPYALPEREWFEQACEQLQSAQLSPLS